MSYFNYERIADGYAHCRPRFHTLVMDMMKKNMKLTEKLNNGLDIGCGAGASTVALREVCKNVVGIDEADQMINMAIQENGKDMNISYKKCSAEKLQFEDDSFDVAAVCGAINWIDETLFLPNAHKILKDSGILLIYDNFISDTMEENPAYTQWWYEKYLKQFPKPPRKENVWAESEVQPYGFHIYKQEKYTNTVCMEMKAYINFMLTQSNVIAKVEEQGMSLEDAKTWFESSLEPVFCGKQQNLVFEGYNWYLINNK